MDNATVKKSPRRESFFVAVQSDDGSVSFFDSTEYIGKQMPFSKPKQTCAVRTDSKNIIFSLLHLTKKSASSVATSLIEYPRGPVSKLARQAESLGSLEQDQIIAEIEGVRHTLTLERDSNNVARIEQEEEITFELPKTSLKISLFLMSPGLGRVISIGFIGHLGKPGDIYSVPLIASKVLHSLSLLLNFRILSGIETVHIPAPSSRYQSKARVIQVQAEAVIPVKLFNNDVAPILLAEGTLGIKVDLEHANPTTGKLLYHYTPSEALKEHFESYRTLIDSTITTLITNNLGLEEVSGITYDIVLGGVEAGTVERLKDAIESILGLDCTPTQFRQHDKP